LSARKRRPDVYLTGFMGAGKSTAGRLLAQRLSWEFVDLDEMIERRAGKTIEAIFAQHGEPAFRQMESEALLELVAGKQNASRVIALGGGTVTRSENLQTIAHAGGLVFFLDAPSGALLRRCREDVNGRARPLAGDNMKFRKLLEKRRASYLEAGTRIDTTDRTVDEVVDEIERRVATANASRAKETHSA
jgi:shikimate kinase